MTVVIIWLFVFCMLLRGYSNVNKRILGIFFNQKISFHLGRLMRKGGDFEGQNSKFKLKQWI